MSRAADRIGPLAIHAVAVVVLGAAVAWRRPLPLLATLVAAGTVVVQAALGWAGSAAELVLFLSWCSRPARIRTPGRGPVGWWLWVPHSCPSCSAIRAR